MGSKTESTQLLGKNQNKKEFFMKQDYQLCGILHDSFKKNLSKFK